MALPFITESKAKVISGAVTKEVITKEIHSDDSKLKEELKEFIDKEIDEHGGSGGVTEEQAEAIAQEKADAAEKNAKDYTDEKLAELEILDNEGF